MMCQTKLNGNMNKKCAFCKHWYDPTNQFIRPKSPKLNIWEYESTAKALCLQRNIQMPAASQCPKFEIKF